jgi:hypothetical protein
MKKNLPLILATSVLVVTAILCTGVICWQLSTVRTSVDWVAGEIEAEANR